MTLISTVCIAFAVLFGHFARMDFLATSHNPSLVLMSGLVALIAGFTGLTLTRDLATKTDSQKKLSIALASIALGGGIWSMHFVAMLGLQLPILFYYDAAVTLVSALSAILIVAAALLLLHFVPRSRKTIAAAGALVGVGVLVMHYIGMHGLELCRAIYTPFGLITSSIVAILLCIMAFAIAYGRRTKRNIFLGTACFAFAIVSVHFLAMSGTEFVATPEAEYFGPAITNEALAIGVILSSFILFATCLWVSVTYLETPAPSPALSPDANPDSSPLIPTDPEADTPQSIAPATPLLQIPCEREGNKIFVSADDVAFIRADGHYTQVYTDQDQLFCSWPITQARKRLIPLGFLQTHRSYVVNPAKVARFEKSKDKGRCLFESENMPPAPVSRSHLKTIQTVLLQSQGATGAS